MRSLTFVLSLKLTQKSKNVHTLVLSSNGSRYYSSTGKLNSVFSFQYFQDFNNTLTYFLPQFTFSLLFKLPYLTKVSNIELYPKKGIQYARSSGVFSIVISKNFYTHTVLIKLPSGLKKIFSFYSSVLVTPSFLKQKLKLTNTKSGYWRSLGYKSKVRGVAMNPIDHPHGGRTKSIKYPRTP